MTGITNTNKFKEQKLAGKFRCPSCGNEDKFWICTTAILRVTDGGISSLMLIDWDQDSKIFCRACDASGTIKAFLVQEENINYKEMVMTVRAKAKVPDQSGESG